MCDSEDNVGVDRESTEEKLFGDADPERETNSVEAKGSDRGNASKCDCDCKKLGEMLRRADDEGNC